MEKYIDIRYLKTGSQKAFKEVYQEHYPGLYRYAMSYLKNEEEVKNIIQEVFILFWNKKSELEDFTNLKAYLVASLKYLLWNEIRKKRRLAVRKEASTENILELDLHIETLDQTPISFLCTNEIYTILYHTLEEQGVQTKEIFILNREVNLSYQEIALRLDISTKSVEYHISKALRALRIALKAYLIIVLFLLKTF
ncbi:sigma-70 family RNA polymerase sigma factor [Sphingobacterium sp. DR205]|uniref:sigma-70 family RNA polymerase sigma factor n=1 Tax=Sphingobacterium sp. DR205 TaxID=2713573 RepID=UPI0013E4508E|nr:sigma-70 family RNA polymerase sigma factor [Sphingobacterium sp. DR205]QIH31618.1 sigma-70 family RNA polymerase sigma factor [Sphingobacterium sp. DR205]